MCKVVMKFLTYCVIMLSFCACFNTTPIKIDVQEKLVPIKCDIDIPTAPILQNSDTSETMLQKLGIYINELLQALKTCTK